MTDESFTKQRAEELKGRKVKTNTDIFSGISEGTVGRVTEIYERALGDEGYGITVTWETENGNKVDDGFSKTEFDEFLEVV